MCDFIKGSELFWVTFGDKKYKIAEYQGPKLLIELCDDFFIVEPNCQIVGMVVDEKKDVIRD